MDEHGQTRIIFHYLPEGHQLQPANGNLFLCVPSCNFVANFLGIFIVGTLKYKMAVEICKIAEDK
jgi:hypothetical protein